MTHTLTLGSIQPGFRARRVKRVDPVGRSVCEPRSAFRFQSMAVGTPAGAGAASSAAPASGAAGHRFAPAPAAARGERGELFLQPAGPAMGTLGALPVTGPHQDLAVLVALSAMKLVDRHGRIITRPARDSRAACGGRTQNSACGGGKGDPTEGQPRHACKVALSAGWGVWKRALAMVATDTWGTRHRTLVRDTRLCSRHSAGVALRPHAVPRDRAGGRWRHTGGR